MIGVPLMIVTVVTPTLNAGRFLRECIQSTQRNSGPGIEVDHVVVDGGSTDGTVEMAQSLGARVLTGKDSGIFDAINKGSFTAPGELLGFLGADDVMLEGALRTVVDAHRSGGREWMVGGIRWIDETGRGMGELAAPPVWMTARMLACLGWSPIMHMGTYFSRRFFTELGGFNIAYKDAGDYDMFARALAVKPFERLSRPIACYRRTGANNSAVHETRMRREIDAVLTSFGPASTAERRFWRYALKVRLNAGNPEWLLHKLAHKVRLRLRLQETAYF